VCELGDELKKGEEIKLEARLILRCQKSTSKELKKKEFLGVV